MQLFKAFKPHYIIILILLTFIFNNTAFTQSPGSPDISQERLNRLDGIMQDYVDKEKLSGNVIYISRRGETIYHKSFGWRDKEAQAPMKNDAMFRIASQSKAITSVGIMILQEQGKLLINDAVGKYLPEYMNTTVAISDGEGGYYAVPAKRKITIRDLLTHTAGIGYGFGPGEEAWRKAKIQGWYFADRNEPIRETVRRMADLPQDAQPGASFVYGYNTDILGALIEVVSGQPLDKFLSDHILKPLTMNDTQFYVPENKKDRLATVYSLKGDTIELSPNPGELAGASHVGQGHYVNGPRVSFSGGAGLVSTAEDYGKFLQMTLNGGILNGKQILSRKSIELMIQNHISENTVYNEPGFGFGLGFQITKDIGQIGRLGTEGEYGWGGAYHSSYWVDPKEELVVVYLTQLIPAGGLDDHAKLRSLIYQSIDN